MRPLLGAVMKINDTKIKAAFYAAAVILPMSVSAAGYTNLSGGTPDLTSGRAAGQLQSFIPTGGNPAEFKISPPPAVERVAENSPGSDSAGVGGARRIFSESDPWHKRLAEALGIGYPCVVEARHIGKPLQTTEKLTFSDGKRKESVVVKIIEGESSDKVREFLWKAYREAAPLSKLEEMGGSAWILKNGIVMNEKFRAAGLKTADIVLADAENMIVVTKFLKGTDMVPVLRAISTGDPAALQAMEKLGSAVAAAHRNDLCIGDLNSGNILFVEGEPYFIDLDRARSGGVKGWDIALAFYYPILRDKAEPQTWAADAARSFLKGYLAGGGDRREIKDALSARYQSDMSALVRSKHLAPLQAVRLEMKKAAGEDLGAGDVAR